MPTRADLDSEQIQRKAAVVDEIKAKLSEADAAVLTEYRGLSVGDLATLRRALREADTEYKIFKNSLAQRAASEVGLSDLIGLLDGPVAIAFVRGDTAAAAAKALRDFARGRADLVVKGGLLGQRVLSRGDIEALADLPSREQLLAMVAGAFQAPLTKAAGLFAALNRNFAYGLKAYLDQRVAAGEAAPVEAEGPGAAEVAEEASGVEVAGSGEEPAG